MTARVAVAEVQATMPLWTRIFMPNYAMVSFAANDGAAREEAFSGFAVVSSRNVVGQQLKQLFPSRVRENGQLPVYVLPSATQPNSSDCGINAAAFAFQWASGTMACDVHFDHTAMRIQMMRCMRMPIL